MSDHHQLPSPRLPLQTQNVLEEERIVHQIASFLSTSEVVIATSVDVSESTSPSANAPLQNTPPVLQTPSLFDTLKEKEEEEWYWNENQDDNMLKNMRHAMTKEKLAAAMFAHPKPLRSFCQKAFQEAQEVARATESIHKWKKQQKEEWILILVDLVLKNVPLSVFLDLVEGSVELYLDTGFAMIHISSNTIHACVSSVFDLIMSTVNAISQCNPLELIQIIVTRPFDAFGKTTEVVVGGIQSVATVAGSASSMALRNLSSKATPSGSKQSTQFLNIANGRVNTKLLKKLSTLNSTAPVVSYTEIADDTGGLSRHAKSRVQRMMHYEINLRPFVATVKLPVEEGEPPRAQPAPPQRPEHSSSCENFDDSFSNNSILVETPSSPGSSSPFMCTPQSFPATPASRRRVLARGSRFADDVIFLARDQLRVHDALDSENERTREMAKALAEGRRLAVFDADDASAGIDLTCGQHVATKVGNMLYGSTRSMVPILRNCFVYFEMTVLPRPGGGALVPQASMATLLIGLSTKEMPNNTMVGAWQGSVGLCTTGQLLTAGQWCTPADASLSAYGDRTTVGCLVCLDDGSAFETWDTVMVTAAVTFTVNGNIVGPPLSAQPFLSSSGETLPPSPPPPVPSLPLPAPPSFTLPLLVPAEEELYPTVTLHSPGVAVLSRFSAGDLLSTSRQAIGAPAGVTVYCVDGSVILNETDP